MLGLFKRMLSRPEVRPAVKVVTAPTASPASSRTSETPKRPAPSPVRVSTIARAKTASPAPKPAAAPNAGISVQISLAAIAASLPESISHKVPALQHDFVAIPVDKILPQLGSGSVVLTAGELRECAPDQFAALAGHDDVPVTLPLADIVKQIPAGLYTRRSQRRLEVPEEVAPIFNPAAAGVTLSRPAATQPAEPVFKASPTVTTSHAPEPAPKPAAASKIAMSPQALAALHAATAKPAETPRPATPVIKPIAATPVAQPAPAIFPGNARRAGDGAAPTALPRAVAPQPSASKAPVARKPVIRTGNETGTLIIPLQSVCEGWVQEVRSQLIEVDVANASIHAPLDQVEPAMKSGKVVFSWSEVAAWIQPGLAIPPTAKTGEMPVDLPLKTIAPLFMAQHRAAAQAQRRVAVDESIPDLFFDRTVANGEKSVKAAAAVTQSAPAAAPDVVPAPAAQVPAPAPARKVFPAQAPAPVAPVVASAATPAEGIALEQIAGSLGRRFSPKEIIQNVTRLPGVAGALLAMSDGLLVTGNVPASVKAETIAAFLPQMFGRMNQYTKELALGTLQHLTLGVAEGDLHILKCPEIYFAVLGRRGEALPLNLLAQVAAELSSQSK